MKIIFVASDFSGLGKGTFAASLGRLIESQGVPVRVMKCDLYYNYDAGTINPGEHGEVYVLADGTETDQDLGLYERFLNYESTPLDYLTSGRVHHQVYLNERAGKYLGQTVSVEHVIDEIKGRIMAFAEQAEVGIVELGATIGDIKGTYFLEACRQLIAELGPADTSFVLLSHFPYFSTVGEVKTMGCQRSVNDLRAKGLKPDVIVARLSAQGRLADYELKKIERFCDVPRAAVIQLPDLDNEYEIPRFLRSKRLHSYLSLKMHIPLGEDRLDSWYTQFDPKTDVRIALVGKYPHKDAYLSILHQLRYHGVHNVEYRSSPKDLDSFDGIIIPGGWGQRGTEELIATAKFARVNRVPCLGICLGLQIMLIEYARNVLGLESANSMEFDPSTPYPVVSLQENQKSLDSMGATSRLGNWTTTLDETSTTARLFQASEITQRHRHRYEINPAFEYGDFKVVGRDKKIGLIEIMELPSHPFYIGVQCHPEFGTEKNPLFGGLIVAAKRRQHSSARTTPSLLSHIVEGTAGTGLISIDIEDRSALDRIAALSLAELHEEGISEKQQIIVRKILALMDERDHALSKIECSIDAYELQMREINIAASPVYEGSGLSNSDRERLAELDHLIEVCKSQIRDGREHYENELSSLDLEMRATMSLAATEADLAG